MNTPLNVTWLSYMDNVVPKNAGQNQIVETKRAFYAGAMITFDLLLNWAIIPDDEEECEVRLKLLAKELEEFRASVGISE